MTQVCTGLSAWVETEVVVALGRSARVSVARRCADMAEVMAVADAGRVDVVLLSPGLQGADRSAVADLVAGGTAVVGIHRPLDESEQRILAQWQVSPCMAADAPLAELEAAITAAAASCATAGTTEAVTTVAQVPTTVGAPHLPDTGEEGIPAQAGEIIVVWGPHGAPGRTSVAVNLAAELDGLGNDVVLVDLDLHAPSIAQHLGLLDEAPGIAASARLAESGRLDIVSLAGVAPVVGERTRVLTGLPRASRWPEIRPDAVRAVLAQCRALGRFVIVDIAAPLEDDEELSYDTRAPRRNGAALAALELADRTIAVAAADPIGLQRLVRDLDELRDHVDGSPQVVVTKVRSSAVGRSPRAAVAEALERFAGLGEVHMVADDRAGFDKAVMQGRTLAESVPDSPARRDLLALALHVSDGAAISSVGPRWKGLRRRPRPSGG